MRESLDDREKVEEFNLLRENIKKRIDELDNFYEDNFDNEFISYFEAGRYKLKKLIQYEPNLINEIDNGNMKAYILAKNSMMDSDIDINNNYYINKFKNKNKSAKNFPEKNMINNYKNSEENLIKYENINKKNNGDDKWRKDIKNRIYNNYYNKNIRKKYTINSEDNNIKENKVKYMDWTENNSIQGNTLSLLENKSNKLSINNSNSNFNIQNNKKIDLKKMDINANKFNNINANKLNNFEKEAKDKKELNNEDDIININLLDDSNRTKSSVSRKNKRNDNININKAISSREILFEIKLTKEEYNMLLKQKKKEKNKKINFI